MYEDQVRIQNDIEKNTTSEPKGEEKKILEDSKRANKDKESSKERKIDRK